MADIVKRLLRKNIQLSYKLVGLLDRSANHGDSLYRSKLKQVLLSQKENLRNKNILDVGSGSWTWTKDTFSPVCKITTFDVTPHANVDIVGDLYHVSALFLPSSFDAVIATDVFEHLANPVKALQQLHRVLKPHGLLIASTPFKKNLHGEEYGDYWRITRQGWQYLLEQAGFENSEISWLGEELFPMAYFVQAGKR